MPRLLAIACRVMQLNYMEQARGPSFIGGAANAWLTAKSAEDPFSGGLAKRFE
jgi:hypothetical protein